MMVPYAGIYQCATIRLKSEGRVWCRPEDTTPVLRQQIPFGEERLRPVSE